MTERLHSAPSSDGLFILYEARKAKRRLMRLVLIAKLAIKKTMQQLVLRAGSSIGCRFHP